MVSHKDPEQLRPVGHHTLSTQFYDASIGLPNRALFVSKLSSCIGSVERSHSVTILAVKLRYFNSIEIALGKRVTEQLLGAVAGRIQHTLASDYFLARVGHHEFAILIAGLSDADSIDLLCRKIEKAFEAPFNLETHTITVQVRVGAAVTSTSEQDAVSLLRQAHSAAVGPDREYTLGEGSSVLSEMPVDLKPGSYLRRFKIIRLLGQGGMGKVYCAYDTALNREVAIKILKKDLSHDATAFKRFHQELRAVAALSHPNIIGLYDIGCIRGLYYAVTERLVGQNLRKRLEEGPIPVEQSLDYGLQICEGLAAAHRKGIVHRDLKPENIFITEEDRIKILDFGLATFVKPKQPHFEKSGADNNERITQPGLAFGTIGYMSPEQVLGELTDERSDIFSFGAVLYEMLCGERAFKGNDRLAVLNCILNEQPAGLESDKAIHCVLRPLVTKCLEKDPKERFSSAQELVALLKCARLGSNQTEVLIPPTSP